MDEFPQIAIADLPAVIRDRVETAISEGDVSRLRFALKPKPLLQIGSLCRELQRHGFYEAVLVKAYRAPAEHRADLPIDQIVALFENADRWRLRACGQPLPTGETFELYRGVAGIDPGRNATGLSWTDSPCRACWFAWRRKDFRHQDPAVYVARVEAANIFLFTEDEREFIAFPRVSPTRLGLTVEEIRGRHDEHQASIRLPDDDES